MVQGSIENQIRQVVAAKSQRREEPKAATAATLATRKLKSMGLTRREHDTLWSYYRELYYQRRLNA